MKDYILDIGAAIVAILLGLVFYHQTLDMPKAAYELPRLLVFLIAGLCILMIFSGYRVFKIRNMEERESEHLPPNYKRVFFFGLIIALYISLIQSIGYFIVTPVFIIVSLYYLKATRFTNMVLIAGFFTAFIYFMFVWFLKLPVPMGILG